MENYFSDSVLITEKKKKKVAGNYWIPHTHTDACTHRHVHAEQSLK